jgi:hypothetical protein
MAEVEKEDFQFPDEVENKSSEEKVNVEAESNELQIEIEDDTPLEDRNRTPSDPAKVKELEVEVDDLDKYSKDAKDKLIRMKRVWNDERRRAESAERERHAAIEAAERLFAENKRMKGMLSQGEVEYKEAVKGAAESKVKEAKRAYKEAYDAGDGDKMAEAQEQMTNAQMELENVKKFKLPPLQEDEYSVQRQYETPQVPRPDDRVMQWQAENQWFGQNKAMTAFALGLHEELKDNGITVGSERYYAELDKTMHKRFSEYFNPEDAEEQQKEGAKYKEDTSKTKPMTNVAPATRSTAPKRVRLSQSQVAIAKRLGLTPEQYVRELLKMEA